MDSDTIPKDTINRNLYDIVLPKRNDGLYIITVDGVALGGNRTKEEIHVVVSHNTKNRLIRDNDEISLKSDQGIMRIWSQELTPS